MLVNDGIKSNNLKNERDMIEYCMSLEIGWIFSNLSYAAGAMEILFFDNSQDLTQRKPSEVFEFVK